MASGEVVDLARLREVTGLGEGTLRLGLEKLGNGSSRPGACACSKWAGAGGWRRRRNTRP